jgi:hypothetical protein
MRKERVFVRSENLLHVLPQWGYPFRFALIDRERKRVKSFNVFFAMYYLDVHLLHYLFSLRPADPFFIFRFCISPLLWRGRERWLFIFL